MQIYFVYINARHAFVHPYMRLDEDQQQQDKNIQCSTISGN